MKNSRPVLAWAFYDWANSAFATTVMAGFFPIFFKRFWSSGADVSLSTLRLGWANSLASLVLAFSAPVLGAIADQGRAKKNFLLFFSMLGILTTGALYWVARGDWQMAVTLFVLASVGFAGGNTFYDSLIVSVAKPEEMDRVSSFGFALGYLGGGVLFALNVAMTLKPQFFGLADASESIRIAFLSVAAWWLVFSLPLFLWVPEPANPGLKKWDRRVLLSGFTQLVKTFADARQIKGVFVFLLAYFFYIDGVNTIIHMAVDYGLALGFSANSLIVALLITQFVGFPSAIGFGYLAKAWNAYRALYLGLVVYVLVTIWGFFMTSEAHFYGLAAAIGLVQGGVQALSRSLYANMIPAEKAAEFFGFYNMLGKFSAIIGPLLVGGVSYLTGEPRYSILSVIILFLLGGFLLRFVDHDGKVLPTAGKS